MTDLGRFHRGQAVEEEDADTLKLGSGINRHPFVTLAKIFNASMQSLIALVAY